MENNDPDIRPIFPTNSTNTTTRATPSDSDNKANAGGLSAGVIAAIVIGSVVFLAILIAVSTILWRRRLKAKVPNSSQSDQASVALESIDYKTEQELHTDPIIPPELEGTGLGPREMEDAVAATEMDAFKEERPELYG